MQDALHVKGLDYGFAFSQYPGHAVELAKEALAAGESRIIAVGGDGTVREVASVLQGTQAIMGILPFGTGNDLAKTLGLPTEPLAALEVLLEDYTRPMDTAWANDRFFINIAGYGFDVDVLQRAERYRQRFNGMLPYLLGVAEALFRPRRLRLTLYGPYETITTDGYIVVVGNGQYMGGGMRAAPQADPYDGLLDVCLFRDMPRYKFLSAVIRFVRGTHLSLPAVDYFKVRELRLECPAGGPLDLDGELEDTTPVTFRVEPGSIRMLVRP